MAIVTMLIQARPAAVASASETVVILTKGAAGCNNSPMYVKLLLVVVGVSKHDGR